MEWAVAAEAVADEAGDPPFFEPLYIDDYFTAFYG